MYIGHQKRLVAILSPSVILVRKSNKFIREFAK